MISVHDAVTKIRQHTALLSPVAVPLQVALGFVLAEDVSAHVSVPAFRQSAMDGYAFRYDDYLQAKEFTVVGEVAAGDDASLSVAPQSAVRIFTGAAVPAELDTVVMQEKTETASDKVIVNDDALQKGSNVRAEGSEIKKGETALMKGDVLSPAAIGFLAGLGITHATVYPKPVVRIIVTGNELQTPGKPLQYGQVYESNSVMLQTALQQLHVTTVETSVVGDDIVDLHDAVNVALDAADLILLTGGVSVGDYDFVVGAVEACGVQRLFHKAAQRPGKPLYCGTKDGKVVFGLPGNPASVLSCFYNYVVVAIERLTGRKALLERRRLPLFDGFDKVIPLTQFLKAVYTSDGVRPLGAQESFRLRSFASSNCLIVLPEEKKLYKKGDAVEILLLPNI